MQTVIAIPTKNRSDRLVHLLESLKHNLKKYNHQIPIHVFDDSTEDKTKQVAKDVIYHGPDKEIIEKTSALAQEDTRFLFENTGGNRNRILHTFPNSRVIMIDDDMIAKQLKVVGKKKWFTNRGNIKLGNIIEPQEMQAVDFDFFTHLLQPFDKRPKAMSSILIAPSRHHLIGYRMPKITLPIAATYATCSYHLDYESSAPQQPLGFKNLKPAYTTGGMTSCMCLDTTIAGSTPYTPTTFRYEDYQHTRILFTKKQGCSYFIGQDMVHIQGPRRHTSYEQALLDDVVSHTAAGISTDIMQACVKTQKDFYKGSIDHSDFHAYIRETVKEVAKKFDAEPKKAFVKEATDIVVQELQLTQKTYRVWDALTQHA